MLAIFKTLSQIFTAGVAITAFSLLLYALTFNLRDRIARSFALILLWVVIIFSSEALGSTSTTESGVAFWMRLQWVGIIFLPPAYLYFSDALLATTGRPSRGRRRWLVRITYLISLGLVILLPTPWLVGSLVSDGSPIPHLQPTLLTNIYAVYYGIIMILAGTFLVRAYRRTITPTNRRRMLYLLAGATAPALGSYPYLLFGSILLTNHPLVYWLISSIAGLLTGGFVVVMAYAVAFFGVPWPDRVIRSRLFKWLLRGPVTASIVLGLVTIVRRAGTIWGDPYTALVPITMVVAILSMEHMITLVAPLWERWFFGKDRSDLRLVQNLQDHLLTSNDLRQFLEAVIAAVCDRLQVPGAFLAIIQNSEVESILTIGNEKLASGTSITDDFKKLVSQNSLDQHMFKWGTYHLIPLYTKTQPVDNSLVGLLGFPYPEGKSLDEDQLQSLAVLTERVELALQDRQTQQEVFSSLQLLNPEVSLIQKLSAAARYDRSGILLGEENLPQEDFTSWVKDALTHYWGGPKLTQSPLIRLRVVKSSLDNHAGNSANALRAILRKAIENVRPDGERRFTGEWVLYNILEMKFLEGRKVREIASRLAMSEADLYRKQRVAIEAVAKIIYEMEKEARDEVEI